MNFECPNCGAITFVRKITMQLVQSFFHKCEQKSILFICERCGDNILKEYRDTYGLGI